MTQFRDEARDHLQRMAQKLFHLEEHPDDLKPQLEEVLRIAHTLKGSARMMGYADISTLAHKMEDLFVEIRDGHVAFHATVTDLVFYCLDTITYLVEGLYKNVKRTADLAEIGALFDALLAGQSIQVPQFQTQFAQHFREEPSPATPSGASAPLPEEREDHQYVRIHTKALDTVLNLVGEVLINQYRYDAQVVVFQEILQELQQHRQQLTDMQKALNNGEGQSFSPYMLTMWEQLEQHSSHLWRKTKSLLKQIRTDRQQMRQAINNLQAHVIDVRMVPAERVLHMLPELVKITARNLGKLVDAQIIGHDTRIDSRIIEEIRDPLIHLIQNAIRHGIESPDERQRQGKDPTGTVTVSAGQEGNRIVIRVQDDGRGIDLARIQEIAVRSGLISHDDVHSMSDQDFYELLFQPGFSTAEVVDDIAGRGLGLDIVRSHIDRVQGEIEVHSRPQQGTTFVLKLPLTLTIMNALLVRVVDQMFAIPTITVEKTIDIFPSQIDSLGKMPTLILEDVMLPVIELRDLLRFDDRHPLHNQATPQHLDANQEETPRPLIVLHAEDRRIGFLVDDLIEERQIVIKPLGPCLKRVRNVAGVTALREEMVMILFVRDLIHSADALLGESVAQAALLNPGVQSTPTLRPLDKPIPRILVVDDSFNTREVERTILENAGYRVETAIHGAEALEKLRKFPIQLVVTDIEMPEMDGTRLIQIMKQDAALSHVPVIVVSSHKTADEQQRSLAAGAVAHIVKGEFDEHTLLDTVKTCLNAA